MGAKDKRYVRILADGKTIPWPEMKSALIARLESAKTQAVSGDYSSSESVETTFAERRAKISGQVHGDESTASGTE